MISRKDSLLIRPWQQRKFEQHRQKVQTALPVIDNGAPPHRGHVAIKSKKQQKEKERSRKIEKDNYLLLQKLNFIMRTNRVDNSWRNPPPNFLNRVAIYEPIVPEIEELVGLDFEEDKDLKSGDRKSKCFACTPRKLDAPKIPEERVPWEPEKKLGSRIRSRSVPSLRKLDDEHLPTIREQSQPSSKPSSSQSSSKYRTSIYNKELETLRKTKSFRKDLNTKDPQSIVLSRGCLKLSVSFPSDTVVKFHEGNVQKFLMRGVCHCRNTPPVKEILE